MSSIKPFVGDKHGIGSKVAIGSFLSDLLAGGTAGILVKTMTAPIDRIKLLLQTQHINVNLMERYTSPIDCIRRVYREQGLLSFWRGNLANVYRYFPSQAMNFAFKDKYKEFFSSFFSTRVENDSARNPHDGIGNPPSELSRESLFVNLLSGGCAGATALLVSYPFDLARTRLATDVGVGAAFNGASSVAKLKGLVARAEITTPQSGESPPVAAANRRVYLGTVDCLHQTYRNEGVRGLYAGFGISIFGAVVFRSLYLGGYDSVKSSFELNHKDSSILSRYLAAQAVTTVVGTLCFPIDTVKRRIMVQRKTIANFSTAGTGGTSIPGGSNSTVVVPEVASAALTRRTIIPYKNALDCLVRILREEGVRRGLFAGLSVNIVRGLGGSLLLVGYDELKALFALPL